MKIGNGALSFSEKERICETLFECNGPFWHLYTDGTSMQNIFRNEEDFNTGMWLLAASWCIAERVQILTFELMSNHIHVILSGQREACLNLFETFRSKIKRAFIKAGHCIDWTRFKAEIIPIENLQALRNEIIYVNRNAFVANAAYTPDSYLWGGGCAYFNLWTKYLNTIPIHCLKINKQREILHSRDVTPYAELKAINGMVYIPSFCDIALGESLFRDARSYFNSLTRNAEAFSQIAARLKDIVFLTDDELYSVTITYINNQYNIRSTNLLNSQQKIDVARHLHINYNASNQQLRRLLRLELAVLNELFPQAQ